MIFNKEIPAAFMASNSKTFSEISKGDKGSQQNSQRQRRRYQRKAQNKKKKLCKDSHLQSFSYHSSTYLHKKLHHKR